MTSLWINYPSCYSCLSPSRSLSPGSCSTASLQLRMKAAGASTTLTALWRDAARVLRSALRATPRGMMMHRRRSCANLNAKCGSVDDTESVVGEWRASAARWPTLRFIQSKLGQAGMGKCGADRGWSRGLGRGNLARWRQCGPL
jgi:hypothetical protein